jgi:hypothetical protein
MAGKGEKLPPPTPQEKELQGMQLQVLKESRALQQEQLRLQDLLAPTLYKSAGLKPRYDAGKIVGFDELDDQLSGMRTELEKGSLQRALQAQRGELGVDPALEREIAEGTRLQDATLLQQLGPGFATSTPGIQARATMGQRAAELRSAARRGEMTLAEQLGLAREGANQARANARLPGIGTALGLHTGQGGAANYQGIAQMLQQMQQERSLAWQAQPKRKNMAMNVGSMAAMGAAAGSLAGPGIGTGVGAGIGGLLGLLM